MNKKEKITSCIFCLKEEICSSKDNNCDFEEATKEQMIERLERAKLLHYKKEDIKTIEDYLKNKFNYKIVEDKREKINLTVTGWISYEDTEKDNCKYEEIPNEYFNDAFTAIVKDIKKWNYNFTGQEHQNEDYCVPVLNDKYYVTCSCRMWGEIMARAHDKYDLFDYVLWAWNTTCEDFNKFVYPDPDNYINDKGVN